MLEVLLAGVRVLELGGSLPVAVCGRLFADQGACVWVDSRGAASRLASELGRTKRTYAEPEEVEAPHIVITADEFGGDTIRDQLTEAYPQSVVVHISPFGLTGPRSDEPASDLTLFAASGIAQLLTGQVDDPDDEPQQRPIGEQSAYISGIAAACAAANALNLGRPAFIEISQHETLATLAITELTRAANGKRARPRKRDSDGNGATVCILPCADGYAAISPREEHQWTAWVAVMGNPPWAARPEFATKPGRVENWDALHALMSEWSRKHSRDELADAAQKAHVPSFPLRELTEHLDSEQLAARQFFEPLGTDEILVCVPRTPFNITVPEERPRDRKAIPATLARLPLSGVRVLDFSWVIAGPTTTRYLAALGAEVIKVEAPGRGDPGRSSELHDVLGQAKKAITLDLKNEAGAALARRLAERSDLLVENFATGVMERFGLGARDLQEKHPGLTYLSASGMGREGPLAKAVAYGTLLQCYSGFAALNGVPGRPPKVGMAWLDPMCGLLLAFIAGAAVFHKRRTGQGARIDFSMVEAMLWTLGEPLLAAQDGQAVGPLGNRCPGLEPHDIYSADGDDEWVAITVCNDVQWRGLCAVVPSLHDHHAWSVERRVTEADTIDALLRAWCEARSGTDVERQLCASGVPAARVLSAGDLADCPHLAARGFWDALSSGCAPGLPWRADFGRDIDVAPDLGQHNHSVVREVLGLDEGGAVALQSAGAFGR